MGRIGLLMLVLFLVVPLGAANKEGRLDGHDLLEHCGEAQKMIAGEPGVNFTAGTCIGYLRALHDFGFALTGAICIPEGVTVRQSVAVTLKYLRDHPENLHKSMATNIIQAHMNAFPCPAKE